jgi:Nif-specific regulatory protein
MEEEFKLVGKSSYIKKIFDFISKATKTNLNVLILGETGVGKELVAKMIHFYSERKNEPFIKINCANLNENLLESELFGYKKGAYTGAVIDKPGLIEEAKGGTIFLDEIGDIPYYLQAKLLSVIEDKELRRLGENKTRKIEARFTFATNKDLYESVLEGNFRQDLYYRISILILFISSLRKRKEDIPVLVRNITEEENKKNEKTKRITQEALNRLSAYDYPGNIRELENIIKRAYYLSDDGVIKAEHIEFENSKIKEKMNITEELYRKIINEKKSFWEVVHYPFLKRELNRREVKEIIGMGLSQTRGSYKKLLSLFNIEQGEKNYKRFMGIISTHKLKC